MFQVKPVNPDNFVQKKNSMHNMLLDISDNSIECCVSKPPPPQVFGFIFSDKITFDL